MFNGTAEAALYVCPTILCKDRVLIDPKREPDSTEIELLLFYNNNISIKLFSGPIRVYASCIAVGVQEKPLAAGALTPVYPE